MPGGIGHVPRIDKFDKLLAGLFSKDPLVLCNAQPPTKLDLHLHHRSPKAINFPFSFASQVIFNFKAKKF